MVKLIDDGSARVKVEFEGTLIQSQLTGNYNYSNIAAAICIGRHFGVPTSDIKVAIEEYAPTNNRSQISNTERNQLILDSYNANPSSVEAALRNFKEFEAPNKWVMLGDMFEMGEWSAEEHQRIAELAQELGFEKVMLAGKDFFATEVNEVVHKFLSTDDLLEFLKVEKPSGKTILIKGSRGMEMERAVPFL